MALTDLEQAALSGELFQPRSTSPTLSNSSSSPVNTDDELGSDLDYDLDDNYNNNLSSATKGQGGSSTTALVKPEPEKGPRTGIKGVLNDKKAYNAHSKQTARDKVNEIRKYMENTAVTIPTQSQTPSSTEDGAEEWRNKRIREFELSKKGLKEIGKEGFVTAVERSGWVLVLIYEPDIPRCQELLNEMLELSTILAGPSAHLDTPITLFRARATTLAFSLLPTRSQTISKRDDEDEDELDEQEEGEADSDVLPTLLAYKDGELERKWIRVDWDIGQGDLDSLLRSEGILPKEGFDDRVRSY